MPLPLVPGAVPVDSIMGSSYEQQISLTWREPLHTYGVIRRYEVSKKPCEHDRTWRCLQIHFSEDVCSCGSA